MQEEQYQDPFTEPVPVPEEENPEFDGFDRIKRGKRLALDGYAESGVMWGAAVAAGVTRQTVWNWLQADLLFAAAWDKAFEQFVDGLEQEAFRRAALPDGTHDILLIACLNSKARQRGWTNKGQIELTGRDGGPMEVLNLSPEQRRARIAELAAKLGYAKREEPDSR